MASAADGKVRMQRTKKSESLIRFRIMITYALCELISSWWTPPNRLSEEAIC